MPIPYLFLKRMGVSIFLSIFFFIRVNKKTYQISPPPADETLPDPTRPLLWTPCKIFWKYLDECKAERPTTFSIGLNNGGSDLYYIGHGAHSSYTFVDFWLHNHFDFFLTQNAHLQATRGDQRRPGATRGDQNPKMEKYRRCLHPPYNVSSKTATAWLGSEILFFTPTM